MNIVFPWMCSSIYSILLEDVPKPRCPRCGHELDMACLTVFYQPAEQQAHVVVQAAEGDLTALEIERVLRENINEGLLFELHKTLGDLKAPITGHVLAYKPLLKELTLSHQHGSLDAFIKGRWRELTPTALVAGLVGLTGLIKGIGGHSINRETGQQLPFEEAFKVFLGMFAAVQFKVWVNILSTQWTADDTFEDALSEHVLRNGILGENGEDLRKTLEGLKENPGTPPLLWYTSQALHASVAYVTESNSDFQDDWCEAYFSFELERLGSNEGAIMMPWRVALERAVHTITERNAWDAIARRISKGTTEDLLAHLKSIADGLGYEELVARVITSINISGPADSLFEITCKMLSKSKANAPEEWPVGSMRPLTVSLIQSGGIELIERLFKHLLPQVAPQSNQQAHLESWYGECMKLLRQPKRFIEWVGHDIRDWEHNLSLERQVDLWNERANAFRLLGNPEAALALTQRMITLIADRKDFARQRFVLLRNRGILLRETGAADESRRQLKELIGECRLEDRSALLESYAATCHILGRHEETIDTLLQAIADTRKEPSTIERLSAYLGLEYALAGRYEEALKALAKVDADTRHLEVLYATAGAYYQLFCAKVEFADELRQRFTKIISGLAAMQETLESQGDFLLASQTLGLFAMVSYLVGEMPSEHLLQRQLALMEKLGRPPDPATVARLTTLAYRQNDHDQATAQLEKLPGSIVAMFGGIHDVSVAYDMTAGLTGSLNELMKAAMGVNAPWPERRLIAELKRDTIGKARATRERKSRLLSTQGLEGGLTDERLASLARTSGPLGVLEWSDTGRGLFAMLTTIMAQGAVQTRILKRFDADILAIREQVMQRLSVWHEGRKGTPFDFAGWSALEAWLAGEIGPFLAEGQHLVIIDTGDLVGLPWHVALSPRWRCSYAAGWTVLLEAAAPQYRKPGHVGIFAAPRYHDPAPVQEAINEAVENTRRWANEARIGCDVYQDGGADRPAFEKLMADCDAVALFCHGYVDPGDFEIALLVSHQGALAPMFAPGRSTMPDLNRLSWRDLQSLKRSAPLVLSAACSTGLQWQAGAGEQMGLWGALRHGGTQALIGPRWDVKASAVLPLLTRVMSKHLDKKIMLVDALYETCVEAQQEIPRWLAWSLALEGNWL